jgi:hypothetical protein
MAGLGGEGKVLPTGKLRKQRCEEGKAGDSAGPDAKFLIIRKAGAEKEGKWRTGGIGWGQIAWQLEHLPGECQLPGG